MIDQGERRKDRAWTSVNHRLQTRDKEIKRHSVVMLERGPERSDRGARTTADEDRHTILVGHAVAAARLADLLDLRKQTIEIRAVTAQKCQQLAESVRAQAARQ